MLQTSPEDKALDAWGRLILWVRHHRLLTRLVGLSVGLVAFLAFLPAYVQIAFWNGLQSNRILVGMLLVFSLLAISLVWSTGQRFDDWAFLFFNLWGRVHSGWMT